MRARVITPESGEIVDFPINIGGKIMVWVLDEDDGIIWDTSESVFSGQIEDFSIAFHENCRSTYLPDEDSGSSEID